MYLFRSTNAYWQTKKVNIVDIIKRTSRAIKLDIHSDKMRHEIWSM